MRILAILAALILAYPADVVAQQSGWQPRGRAATPAPRPPQPEPGVEVEAAPAQELSASAFCEVLVTQMTQAETMLRQMAITLNASVGREPMGQSVTRVAWMDHWVGRMTALIEATTPANCFDEERLDRLRITAAQYNAFAVQAREFALRPPGAPPVPAAVERRRQQREAQQREQALQQSLLP